MTRRTEALATCLTDLTFSLNAAGVETFESDTEMVHIPSIQNAAVRILIHFQWIGSQWDPSENLSKPIFTVEPIYLINSRRTNHSDPAKAVAKAQTWLQQAAASKAGKASWDVKNKAVADLIAPTVEKYNTQAKEFGFGLRFKALQGIQEYGNLEIFRHGEDPTYSWQDSSFGVQFPRINAEGTRLPALEGPVSTNRTGTLGLATGLAVLSILYAAAHDCEQIVKEV